MAPTQSGGSQGHQISIELGSQAGPSVAHPSEGPIHSDDSPRSESGSDDSSSSRGGGAQLHLIHLDAELPVMHPRMFYSSPIEKA